MAFNRSHNTETIQNQNKGGDRIPLSRTPIEFHDPN